MRALIRLIGVLIAAAIVAALAIFAVENITLVPLHYIGKSFNGNLWWICVGSAVLGFILAFLLLAPGRVAAGWRGRTLGRERARLQDELAVVHAREDHLRAEHARLRAQHDQVAAERDWLRQSAATETPSAAPVGATGTPVQSSTQDATLAGEPLVPPARAVGQGDLAAEHIAPERQTTLGGRLRGALGGPRQNTRAAPAQDETSYPDGPAIPAQ